MASLASTPQPLATLAVVVPVSPLVSSGACECQFASAWGAGSKETGLAATLKELVDKCVTPAPLLPSALNIASKNDATPLASVHRDYIFCRVSYLGAHFDADTKEKIWSNQYVDIWSLVSFDQHMVDREQRFMETQA